MYWNGWPLERIVILFASAAFLLVGVQVTMFHYRQNFHHKAMWAPVYELPVFFIVGLLYSFYAANWLGIVFVVCMWVGIFSGLLGFYYHIRGVGIRVGGYALRNFLIGPPVILPLLISALSVLALFGYYWR